MDHEPMQDERFRKALKPIARSATTRAMPLAALVRQLAADPALAARFERFQDDAVIKAASRTWRCPTARPNGCS